MCNELATERNAQSIPVCKKHKHKIITLTCTCGNTFELLEGKWGTYANCPDCGNTTLRKALQKNEIMKGA